MCYIYPSPNIIITQKNINSTILYSNHKAINSISTPHHFQKSKKKMQATSPCSLMLLPNPPLRNLLRHKLLTSTTTTTRRSFNIHASKRDSYGHHYDGKSVDENMILLRMRIREIEKVEMKSKAPSDWTEWEKKYFENYDSDVYEVVGLLQRLLMNTRPCFAMGMLALVMLSMSTSMSLVVSHLLELAKGII